MICKREIPETASALGLLPSVVEKDYVLGWLLAGINAHPDLAHLPDSLSFFCLPICVSNGYTAPMTKDSGLRIRVQRDLRDKFIEVCRSQDTPAAQIIREFMRDYVQRHGRGRAVSPAVRKPQRQGRAS